MSGQLGDMPPPTMASPKKQPPTPTPTPSATPAPSTTLPPPAVDSKPVVAAEQPQLVPDTKVVPTTTPTCEHDASQSAIAKNSPQETEQSNKKIQPPAVESVSEIHAEVRGPVSESVAESCPAVDLGKNCEKIAQSHSEPEREPLNFDQQSAAVSESTVGKSEQSSTFKVEENHSHTVTEPSNVEQPAPVCNISPVQQQENISLTSCSDETSVSTGGETAPNSEIPHSETAVSVTDNEKHKPSAEKLSEVLEEPKPAMNPEEDTQEVSDCCDLRIDVTAAVKGEKIIEAVLDIETPPKAPAVRSNVEQNQTTEAVLSHEITLGEKVESESEKSLLTKTYQPPSEVMEHINSEVLIFSNIVHEPDEKSKHQFFASEDKGQVLNTECRDGESETYKKESAVEKNVDTTVNEPDVNKEASECLIKGTAEGAGDKVFETKYIEAKNGETEPGNKSSVGKAFKDEAGQKDEAAGGDIEIKAEKGKFCEEKTTEQDTAEEANDQEMTGAQSSTAALSVWPEIEKTEAEREGNYESLPAEESVLETVTQESKGQDMVKESEQSSDIGLFHTDMQGSDRGFGISDITEACSETKLLVAESPSDIKKELYLPTACEEAEHMKASNLSLNDRKENDVKNEGESPPVSGNIQENILFQSGRNPAAVSDVGEEIKSKNRVSEKEFEKGGATVSASVPVEQPEIPVCVDSDQNKDRKDEKGNQEVTVLPPKQVNIERSSPSVLDRSLNGKRFMSNNCNTFR